MINVLDTIKQAYDKSTTQVDKIVLNGQEYRISNVQYYDDVYEEGNIFGTAIAKGLDFEIENTMDLEGQEIEYLTGIMVGGITQWISLGNFIIQDVQPNDTTNIAKVTAMDYMLKTNIPYITELNYADGTVTLLDVLQEVCDKSGIILATVDFTNSTFVVDSNQFTEETLNRQVIQAVAQVSGTVAKIRNNKLYLINPNQIKTVSKVFTLNSYKEAEIKRATHPINLVSLGMADIEGENITLRDETSIAKNGENSLVINDNPFAYTQTKREQLITALFNAVKGFEYKSYSFKNCQGLPYLETLDKIQFKDKEGNTYDSFIFRFNNKSPNGLESTIEAPSITKATVAYQNVPSALDIAKRTEIKVDKQNQKIESVINNVTEQNNKISQVTQTVDELNSKIQDIADITTFGESMYGKVKLDSINESEPIQITVKPTVENISYLYPHENLYPSDDLFLKDRKIRFTNKTDNNYIDYILPDDLLIAPDGTYDEFYLGYDEQVCQITKRCQYNADGTVSKLDAEQIVSYEYPKIELKDGDYTIELLGYANAYLSLRLMAQNIYTTQFATKAEVKSEISQKADEVNISVDKKLSNYSTTTEMRSEINATANSINLEVRKKVNNEDFNGANIMLAINNDTSSAVINADKISLNGKEINLTSDNTTIKSTNFSVDKNGNMSCSNASITGGKVTLYGEPEAENPTFKIVNPNQPTTYVDITSGRLYGYGDSFLHTQFFYNIGILGLRSSSGSRSILSGGFISIRNDSDEPTIQLSGSEGNISCVSLTQTSLEESKKNFERLENGLDIVKNTDIYKYNLKSQKDTDKKHIGFVIGESYNYSKEITSENNDGVDTYSMISVAYKAIQEQQELIEQLQNEINELKKESE